MSGEEAIQADKGLVLKYPIRFLIPCLWMWQYGAAAFIQSAGPCSFCKTEACFGPEAEDPTLSSTWGSLGFLAPSVVLQNLTFPDAWI